MPTDFDIQIVTMIISRRHLGCVSYSPAQYQRTVTANPQPNQRHQVHDSHKRSGFKSIVEVAAEDSFQRIHVLVLFMKVKIAHLTAGNSGRFVLHLNRQEGMVVTRHNTGTTITIACRIAVCRAPEVGPQSDMNTQTFAGMAYSGLPEYGSWTVAHRKFPISITSFDGRESP